VSKAWVSASFCYDCTLSVCGPGSGYIGLGHFVQGTPCSRDALSKEKRSVMDISSLHREEYYLGETLKCHMVTQFVFSMKDMHFLPSVISNQLPGLSYHFSVD
jgi:hypothetical protein